LANPYANHGSRENVDSGAPDGLLRRFYSEIFSITYSGVEIVQARIVETIHPLLNKKMLAHWSLEIISFAERSGLRLHLAVLNEMGGSRG